MEKLCWIMPRRSMSLARLWSQVMQKCIVWENFWKKNGFEVGKYHQVEDLHLVLKEYFGVDVYPTFVAQGTHPFLHEVGVLYSKDSREKLDHPIYG
ncbi:hypothetical protein DCAR_0100510 [Daucus carota subsp. sativus]|uniref:Uncharacterized protein n=1 Tax=Daucus carota subsp. sativus TaxID=79200 RepID=A0A166FQ46_DAUCS|nr:hypothetical protein DCAR_0100510 [Daucus carota subsp. sativus]